MTVKDDSLIVTTKQVNCFVLDSFTIKDNGKSDNPSEDQSEAGSDVSDARILNPMKHRAAKRS